MRKKLGPLLLALAFAIPFGGIGAGAAWVMATMIYDGIRAEDWVRVKADVTGTASYRYTFNGQTYTGERLGTVRIGGTSDVDDFDERVAAILEGGREQKRPITVYVNPDNPSEAMVDRAIRWGLLVFLVPFAFAFGAVGIGALVVAGYALFGSTRKKSRRATPAAAAGESVLGIWIFAFFWNVIAFPIALLAVPQLIQQGEWVGLFILIFPLVGLGLLWWALSATFARFRRGRARFTVTTDTPRVGAPLEGHVEFKKGVAAGARFIVRLACQRVFDNGEDTSRTHFWVRNLDVKAVATANGARLPFHFDIPADAHPTTAESAQPVRHHWYLEVEPATRAKMHPDRHEIEVQRSAFGTRESPSPGAAAEPRAHPAFDSIEKMLAGTKATKQTEIP